MLCVLEIFFENFCPLQRERVLKNIKTWRFESNAEAFRQSMTSILPKVRIRTKP